MTADLAFGITAGQRPDLDRLGVDVERLGYVELWTNSTLTERGLATLEAASVDTSRLRFGIGVVALSEETPEQIAPRVGGSPIAQRLTLGVGSGSSRSLDLVRDGVTELGRLLPETPIAIAAVGPRMLHLAGEVADAVVAAWALPERLAWSREQLEAGAAAAGRPVPRLVAYVRTAVGSGAEERLRQEMDRYARRGAHYARAFAEQPPDTLVGIAAADASGVQEALEPYRSVADTVVVRGLPVDDSVDAWVQIARAGSPLG